MWPGDPTMLGKLSLAVLLSAMVAACSSDDHPPQLARNNRTGGSGGIGSGDGGTGNGAGTSGRITGNPISLTIGAKDIAYDPATGRVYASVGANDLNYPNSLVAISAEGAVEWSVFVGSDPGHVAVADDGSAVYVSLEGAGAVREVDPATGAATNQFTVGVDSFMGTMYASDLIVLPGQPRSVALVPRAGGYSQGVYVFDDGVRRGGLTPADPWATAGTGISYFPEPGVIVAASESQLYAYNNGDTGFDFMAITVGATGLVVTSVVGSVFEGFSLDMAYSSGRVFSTGGAVVDPSGPSLLGTLPLGDTWAEGPVLPSPAGDYAYFLMDEAVNGSPWGTDHVMLVCNVGTFTCSTRIVLMWQQSAIDPLRITRWGDRGVAGLFTGWLLLEPDVLP